MHTYIKELLNTNNRVIIPDFGAFIVKHGAKRLVIFNEFLKYNDGLLIDFVAEKEGIPKDDASKKVTEFVTEMSGKLKTEKQYMLGDFGKLEMNNLNKIIFHQEGSVKEAAKTEEKTGKEPVQENKEPPKSETPGKEAQKAPAASAESKQPGEQEQKKPDHTAAQKASSEQVKTKETPKTGASKTEQPSKPEEKTTAHSAAPPAGTTTRTSSSGKNYNIKAYSPPPKKTKRPRKRKQKFITAIIIIAANVLLIAAILIVRDQFGFGNDSKEEDQVVLTPKENANEESATNERTGNETAPEQDADQQAGQIADDIADELSVNNANTKEVTGSSTNRHASGKYFVVGGCFSIEGNADRFVNTLREKGYAAQKFGKINNLHAVSYESFPTFEQAQQALNQIRSKEANKAWVYKMN